MNSVRLCRIVTVPLTFKWLFWEQLRFLVRQGVRVTLVSSAGRELDEVAHDLGVESKVVEMPRTPSPWRDLRAVFSLYRWLRRQDFDVIHSSTPKAGMVAALAGWLGRVPVRVHTYTGQVWADRQGLQRVLLKGLDTLVGRLATHCLADSHSQARFLVEEGVVPAEKLSVIGAGSVAGVDLERFDPERWQYQRPVVRRELNIAPDSMVIGFIGRLRADKGLNELVKAFRSLTAASLDVHLLLIGPSEDERSPLEEETRRQVHQDPRIHLVGYTPEPERFLSAVDIFAFPSYREGFGSVVIEAAAMGIPTVATNVPGCMDSVQDGVTGRLIPVRDAAAIAHALHELLTNEDLRMKMGRASRERAREQFASNIVNRLLCEELLRMNRDRRAR